MSMGTMPRNQAQSRPMAQPMARPGAQQVTGGRTTLAQRQAMTPFRNYNKPPVAKMNPLTYAANQQAMTQQPPPPMNLPDIYGYPVEDASFQPQPFNQNPNPVSNMGGGGMPQQQFNGQLDLSGMMGQQGDTGQSALQSGQQGLQAGMTPQQQYQNYSNAVFGGNPNSVYTPNFNQNQPGQQRLQTGQNLSQMGMQGLGASSGYGGGKGTSLGGSNGSFGGGKSR